MSKILTARSTTYRMLTRLFAAVALCLTLEPAFSQSSNSPEAKRLFKDAFDLYQAREYPAASKLFEEALKLDERDAMGWKYYGEVQLQLNNRKQARTALRRAVELLPVGKDRAIIESRLDGIGKSVLPGPECESVIKGLDPQMLKELIESVKTDDIFVPGTFILWDSNLRSNQNISTRLCGESYVITEQTFSDGQRVDVSVLGLPLPLHMNQELKGNIGGPYHSIVRTNLKSVKTIRWENGHVSQIAFNFSYYRNVGNGSNSIEIDSCSFIDEIPAESIHKGLKGKAIRYECTGRETVYLPSHGFSYSPLLRTGGGTVKQRIVEFHATERSQK